MNTVRFAFDKEIPVIADVDVLVAGGGPGGLGAAVMSAKCGAKTMLVERYGCLGGMSSYGEVSPFMHNHYVIHENGKEDRAVSMDRPVYLAWAKAMAKYLPVRRDAIVDGETITWPAMMISKDASALGMEDVCLEAGVKLLFHHNLVSAIVKDRKIQYAVFASKSGFVAIKAKTFVDATGDGDLAALAGCEFEFGGPSGKCQPMTLCFKLSNVDKSRIPQNIHELYNKAKEDGKIQCPRENVLRFNWIDNDVIHFNTTRVIGKSGVDGMELSEAEVEARRQLRQFFFWLRESVPGFEEARLHSMGGHIGIRETRRIKGLNYLTRENFNARSKFADAITRCNYPIDIHSVTGSGTELVHMNGDEYYEIPYGCIVAKDVDNLTIGGRPISVDHAVHSSMRVMPPACSVGQAAGAAAAMAAAGSTVQAKLDGLKVRETLVRMGAWL